MILVSLIEPALKLCVLLLFLAMVPRFFRIKSKLTVSGLKDGFVKVGGKKKRLIVWALLFFLVCFAGKFLTETWAPDMLISFNYEEAAKGMNPNGTRFNESNILSNSILEKVVQRGALEIEPEKLSEFLSISTPLDSTELDPDQVSTMKVSTQYWVHCSNGVALYHTDPKTVLSLFADVYWEDFVHNYAENAQVLDLTFDGIEEMEYLDVKDYLEMQARKLKKYLPGGKRDSGSFRTGDNGDTFSSLSKKIDNFIDIELERYEAFVLKNGLSMDGRTYQARMQYVNHILDADRMKNLASRDVRIETIEFYDSNLTRYVLIPTYDTNEEFYMSRTKVGVDYFADEAKEYLASATKLTEEMEHNTYAFQQVGASTAPSALYEQADQWIEDLRNELLTLSDQCQRLCDSYTQDKRDGYMQIMMSAPSAKSVSINALILTALFAAVQSGHIMMSLFDEGGERGKPCFGKKQGAGNGKEARREEAMV